MKAVREVEIINAKEELIRLVQQYQNLIFSICLKFTGDYFAAEDLTQEIFLAAACHLDSFDGRAEKAWLCRIATNKCIDYRKSAARRMIPVAEEELPVMGSVENEPLQLVLTREAMKELESKCRSLPSPYAQVALNYFIKGQRADEIARQSGDKPKTIQTRIYRAREMLKKSYGKELLMR